VTSKVKGSAAKSCRAKTPASRIQARLERTLTALSVQSNAQGIQAAAATWL